MGIWRTMWILSKMNGGHKHGHGEKSDDYSVCHEARYWEQPCYHNYMKEHGKHFSKAMAKWAVSMNEWTYKTGKGEYWTVEQVAPALKSMGVNIDETNKFDAYYLANTKYADHSGTMFTDAQILQLVADIMNDKDGYDGMPFQMWLTKMMDKCVEIPFSELM